MIVDWQSISIKDLAGIVCTTLKERGIDAVLVGGACVSIYTESKYLSYDLDFVSHSSMKTIAEALMELDFTKGDARYYARQDCPFFIEIVAPPVAVGHEPVARYKELKTRLGSIVMLTATDCVKDRLSAFYHWNDPQALEQAKLVTKAQKVDMKEIKRWSVQEGQGENYEIFAKSLSKATKKKS